MKSGWPGGARRGGGWEPGGKDGASCGMCWPCLYIRTTIRRPTGISAGITPSPASEARPGGCGFGFQPRGNKRGGDGAVFITGTAPLRLHCQNRDDVVQVLLDFDVTQEGTIQSPANSGKHRVFIVLRKPPEHRLDFQQMTDKSRIDHVEARAGQYTGQRLAVVVEEVGRRKKRIEPPATELRIQTRDIVDLNYDEAAGLQHAPALCQCGKRIAKMIEYILQGDHIEIVLSQWIIFERTGDNPVRVTPAREIRIFRHDFAAVALPPFHHIEEPAGRTTHIQQLP